MVIWIIGLSKARKTTLEGISPVKMTSAYGTFPNKGEHIELKGYTRVENNTGFSNCPYLKIT